MKELKSATYRALALLVDTWFFFLGFIKFIKLSQAIVLLYGNLEYYRVNPDT